MRQLTPPSHGADSTRVTVARAWRQFRGGIAVRSPARASKHAVSTGLPFRRTRTVPVGTEHELVKARGPVGHGSAARRFRLSLGGLRIQGSGSHDQT